MKFDGYKAKIDDFVDSVKDFDFKGNIDSLKNMSLKEFKDMKDLAKFRELYKKNEQIEEKKKNNIWIWILVIIEIVVVCAGIGYAIYKFLVPDYVEDSFDEFEDFDDDFFEDDDDDLTSWDDEEEEVVEVKAKEPEASKEEE